jgi:hypothetical protein
MPAVRRHAAAAFISATKARLVASSFSAIRSCNSRKRWLGTGTEIADRVVLRVVQRHADGADAERMFFAVEGYAGSPDDAKFVQQFVQRVSVFGVRGS